MRIGSRIKLAGLVLAIGLTAAAMPASAQPAQPYQSPMRAQCEEELEKDAAWRAAIKEDLRGVVHDEEAKAIVNNKRHVVMAYAALWVLVVMFLLFMWTRQRHLQGEIERLEREVARASEEA